MLRSLKKLLKLILPPFILLPIRLINQKPKKVESIQFSGNYSSWKEAQENSKGYNSKEILGKVKNSLLKVKNKEAAYERDSVIFEKTDYSWPLLSCLLKISIENKNDLNIIDFGGSLGSTYFQHKSFFPDKIKLQWNIIEQPSFVEEGKKHFENEELKFYFTIEDLLKENNKPTVILFSSVLQYLETPMELIEQVTKIGFDYIIIDRTAFIESDQDIITVQHIPESIYKASYPAWFFSFNIFNKLMELNYTLLTEFDSKITSPMVVNGVEASWRGFLYKRKY